MVITQTPYRMSFFGGGTDYPPFFQEYGGSVISTTFDKYCYVTARHLPQFFDYRNQITYRKIERTNCIEDIEHPAVHNAMKMLNMYDMHLAHESDLPSRSGLGSSSAFAAGMIEAFYALKGKHIGKYELAQKSIYLERTLCNEKGGWQDQIAVAYGGLNRIDFKDNNFYVNPIVISNERKELLDNHLMLFFTGFSRMSSDIADLQIKATNDKTRELKEMLALVDDAEQVLTSKCDILEFGRMLDYTWSLKRGLTEKTSNSTIDNIYRRAKNAGAIGGKLMGAGGGGFFIIFAEPDKQEKIKEELRDLLHVPFQFTNEGTRILYYVPEYYNIPETKEK